MKRILAALTIVTVLFTTPSANTKPQSNPYTFDSGSAFLRDCKLDNTDSMTVMCGFYAKGLADGFMIAEIQHNTQRTICPRAGVSADQAARVVRKYIEDNPQFLDFPVMVLAYQAFEKAFPCGTQK